MSMWNPSTKNSSVFSPGSVVADDPENAVLKSELATSLSGLSEFHWARKNMDSAMAAALRSLDIQKALTADDPTNAKLLLALADALYMVGNVHRARGQFEPAISTLTQSVDLKVAVSDGDPENVDLRLQAARTWHRLGNAYAAKRDFDEAIRSHEEGLATSTSAWGLVNTAVAYGMAGDVANAIHYAERAFEGYALQLTSMRAVYPSLRGDFRETFVFLSGYYRKAGMVDKAIEQRVVYLEICQVIADKHPDDPNIQSDLARLYTHSAGYFKGEGHKELAGELYEKGLAIWKRLAAASPVENDYANEIKRVQRGIARLSP
ncbi:MAG: tetratricopeptide repeat protein [Planctomycetes bacterium]|nr:tetratricopeptide repeat protein [Planctomycetota bacterium]